MNTKPKRRWYQFSMRTMFVAMTLLCAALSWVGYSLTWIRQRHQWLATHEFDPTNGTAGIPTTIPPPGPPFLPTAPGGLWLFGEKGLLIAIVATAEDEQIALRLFPEASVAHAPSVTLEVIIDPLSDAP